MLSSSEVKALCPSVSLLFASLGASLGTSHNFCPLVGGFVGGENSLGLVIADLLPLLCQSVDWFKNLVSERRAMFEVRSSELETGLSSSDDPVEGDNAVSVPREIRAFHAFEEVCGLDGETLARFRDKFQFSDRVRVRLPGKEERACHFSPGEVCFYEAAFLRGQHGYYELVP
ncbi:hypothetical protein SO802_032530 [Lithocarpus litseifolius]|uniref:Uncharacterized protein n=1 Tax=Lithocarpus litseifolius TaxID=425828 RepID=A0AAW2BDS0_9ROSI